MTSALRGRRRSTAGSDIACDIMLNSGQTKKPIRKTSSGASRSSDRPVRDEPPLMAR
jgi:hypothetical protein